MTLLYADPVFLQHETGHHPECPARLLAITGRLHKSGLITQCREEKFEPLSEEAVAAIHDRRVIEIARSTARRGGGCIDADTIVSSASFDVALAAAGACVAAVDAVLTPHLSPLTPTPLPPGERGRGEGGGAYAGTNALCLVRPPGHHATPERSMGFCLFNNIALAAHHARAAHGLSRILIIDWDVHHGNGTQDIFYADAGIFFVSIHRYGHGFYPGSGAADETGTRAGLGFTLNVPVRYGTRRHDFHSLAANALEKAADKIKPELVLISAGFDAHVRDPIGSLDLETEDFSVLTRLVLDIARTHAHGRLVSCLEGGYNLDALGECVQAHLEELL